MTLEEIFELGDKDKIERALFQEDVDSLVIVDWREEEESIVESFAKATGADLTSEWTEADDLLISYEGRKTRANLQMNMGDRYRALRTLRDLLADKYEIRIVRESLLSDTHLFIVKDKKWWQEFDLQHGELTTQIFTNLTDDIEFM